MAGADMGQCLCSHQTIIKTHPTFQVPNKRQQRDQEKTKHRPTYHNNLIIKSHYHMMFRIHVIINLKLEMFYLNSTLNFGIPPVSIDIPARSLL